VHITISTLIVISKRKRKVSWRFKK